MRQTMNTSAQSSEDDFDVSIPPLKKRRISEDNENEDKPSIIQPHILSRIQRSKILFSPASTVTASPHVPTSSGNFESLNVSPWLVHSLSSMAIRHPTEIQKACIPEILKGRDCIGGSRTGTGKTIAFAVPILQKWAEDPFGIYAVILTPTRELALQIYEQFLALGAAQSVKVVLITGGNDMRPQALALEKRPHIVVATPGRLSDHILTSGEETIIGLKRAKILVLDEADRLLASGPGSMLSDLETCFSALPPPTSRLTLLFTATVTPEVRALKSMPRPKDRPPIFISEINDPENTTATSIDRLPSTLAQTYIQAPLNHKDSFLHVLLSVPSLTQDPKPSIIIFTNRTKTADILHRTLHNLSHKVTSLHSDLPQSQRNKNLSSFRQANPRILIATDVASRGLDIPDVQLVINYDIPRNPTDYVHRVGRTARAGRPGTSITFVGQRDVDLVLAIEKYIGGTEDKKMQKWEEEGVNLETRVLKGRTLKDVGEARLDALRDVELGRDINGMRRNKLKKDRKVVFDSTGT